MGRIMIFELITGDMIDTAHIRIVSQMCLHTRQNPEKHLELEPALQHWHYFTITLAGVAKPIAIGTYRLSGLGVWQESGHSAEQVKEHREYLIKCWRQGI
jgi:hypothetical protein